MRLLNLKYQSCLKARWALLFAFIIFPIIIFAQKKTISGVLSDNTGKPIARASVLVKKSRVGTTTNNDGMFSISAGVGDVLIFSAVNHTAKEIVVANQAVIDVQLSSSQADLGDVVVVGYGTQKKSNLTSAVSQIDGKILEARPITNAIAGLQGASPGLVITRGTGQPGKEDWNLNIRGVSSINGTNSPFVIIDGTPGSLSTLNPNDIESISVLKDAAAAAIYGAESASGVIIVTTKSGKAQSLKIEYSGIITSNKAYNRPERAHSWEEAEMQNLSRRNAGQSDSWSESQIRWFKSPDTNYLKNADNSLLFDYYEDINYVKLLMKDKTGSQNHNVSFSGGNEKNNYLFSVGYYDQSGVFKFGSDATKRINARMNANFILNDKLSFNSKIGYTNTNTEAPASVGGTNGINNDYGLIYGIYQTRGIYPVYIPKADGSTAGSYQTGRFSAYQPYYVLAEGGGIQEKGNYFESVFTLKVANIVKGLSLRAVYSPQVRFSFDNMLLKSVPLWDAVKITSYYNQGRSFTRESYKRVRNHIQYLADYDLKLNKQNIHILGGYQFDKVKRDLYGVRANGIISNDIPSLNFVLDPASNPPSPYDTVDARVLISWFARANYSFDDKYLLEATWRYDQSSQLAPGYRSAHYYSVSAGWNVHNEKWFKNISSVINQLKLRASWGRLGNSSVLSNYDYVSQLTKGSAYPFGNVINNSIYERDYVSLKKGWETIESTNFGLDVQFFKRQFSASFDYFTRNNLNMLIRPTVWAGFGLFPSQQNDASLKSKGWEVDLKWNSKVGALKYWVGFNISDSRNTITKYNGQSVYKEGLNRVIEGLPINTIWGYQTNGYFQNSEEVAKAPFQSSVTNAGDIRYMDQNNDNKINTGTNTKDNHGDLVNLGETTPHYLFGGNLGFEIKGFDFSALIQGVGERKMLIYARAALPYLESWRQGWKINLDYWTPENSNAKFPRLYLGGYHNASVSQHWVQNASYMRLKNLQVGYTIPVKVTEKIKIGKARIYLTGQDMWERTGMWYNYFDPEQPSNNSENGNSSFNYPFFRSYAIGINVTF